MSRIQAELETIFRRVFDDDELTITRETQASDVNGWDSIAHVNLIIAIEKHFGVRFAASELAAMRGAGQTAGTLIQLLEDKTASTRGGG